MAAADTLGIARYRAGMYREAITTLSEADALNRATGVGYARVSDLVFQAMAHFRLGERAEARRLLAEVRELSAGETDSEIQGFVREAESLIGATPGR